MHKCKCISVLKWYIQLIQWSHAENSARACMYFSEAHENSSLSLSRLELDRYWSTLQHCHFSARNTGLISSRFRWLAAFWKGFPHTSPSLIVLIGPELKSDLWWPQEETSERWKIKMQWYWLFFTCWVALPSWLINNTLTENAQTKLMEKGITLRNGLTHSTHTQTHRIQKSPDI